MYYIFVLIFSLVILLIDIILFKKHKKILNVKITNDNKILFYKFKKNYLNKLSLKEYNQLISFLYNDYRKRCKK